MTLVRLPPRAVRLRWCNLVGYLHLCGLTGNDGLFKKPLMRSPIWMLSPGI